jgi:hypothetical protein
MSTVFDIILFVWFLVITRVTYRLSVKTQENNIDITHLKSSMRGVKLALKVISVRHRDPD